MKKILFILDGAGRIPQIIKESQSIDHKEIGMDLISSGYEVEYTDFDSLNNESEVVQNAVIIYASSQITRYKKYIEDSCAVLKEQNFLIPSYELLLAHEDKIIQSLLLKQLDINSPRAWYISSSNSLKLLTSELTFPAVMKQNAGYASKSVFLCHNSQALKRNFKKIVLTERSFADAILESYRKIKFWGKYPQLTGKALIQEFLPNDGFDFKVLIFWDIIFILKRYSKPNDWKASGSGLFEFISEVDRELLEFALDAREKINAPYLSLDILLSGDQYYLIEFQATHFGLITMESQTSFWKKDGVVWKKFNKEKSNHAYYFSYAIKQFLSQNP